MVDTAQPAPHRVVFGEESITKVVGVYADRAAAGAARERLAARDIAAVMLQPADARRRAHEFLSRSFEPESRGIWHSIIRAHLLAGAIGLAVGLCIWGVLRAQEVSLVASSPMLALVFIVFFTTVMGLMVGGLLALRPDHSMVFEELRTSLRAGSYAVVAHPTDADGVDAATRLLEPGSQRVTRTL